MRERNIDWLPPVCALTWGRLHSLAMRPDWALNPQTFSVWDNDPTN